MQYEFSEEDRLSVLKFLNEGDASVLDGDSVNRLFTIHDAINRKLISSFRSARRENAQLSRRMSRFEKKEDQICMEGEFYCRGVDSVTVALAVLYCYQHECARRGISPFLSMDKLGYLVFEVYAYCLASFRERLTLDVPQFYGYTRKSDGRRICVGPCFFRVRNRLEETLKRGYQATPDNYNALAEVDKDAAGVCWGVARKYADIQDSLILRSYQGSEPYRDAHPDNNAGKFSREYSDALVYAWKKSQLPESRNYNNSFHKK